MSLKSRLKAIEPKIKFKQQRTETDLIFWQWAESTHERWTPNGYAKGEPITAAQIQRYIDIEGITPAEHYAEVKARLDAEY